MDPSSYYRTTVARRLRESIRGGRFAQLEPYIHLSLPTQLSVGTVETLLDPLGRNISFGDNWADRAREELAPPYGPKVTSLPPTDLLVVSACEKLRNAIAHMSSHAVDELNSALIVLGPVVDNGLVRTAKLSARHPGPVPCAQSRSSPTNFARCPNRAEPTSQTTLVGAIPTPLVCSTSRAT